MENPNELIIDLLRDLDTSGSSTLSLSAAVGYVTLSDGRTAEIQINIEADMCNFLGNNDTETLDLDDAIIELQSCMQKNL